MHPRQDTVEIFSTFIQFDYDRFGVWVTDTRLRRSMKSTLETSAGSSANFWALYWHRLWQENHHLAREHLSAYLQEVCFWSATKTVGSFNSNQYRLADCFQIAIARIDRVLQGFDRELGYNLKSYASITFSNTIREALRQQKEIDICTDWSLLRKLSQKRMTEALAVRGLNRETIERYILACNCLKTLYVPERAGSTRRLSQPSNAIWQEIANLYNQRKTLLTIQDSVTVEQLQQWLSDCAKAGRDYLFPSVSSIDRPKPGADTIEIVDSLVGESNESLVSELIAREEAQQRSQQRSQLEQFLAATVAQLKPEEQKLLELYYSLGLKQVEIALEMNTQQYAVSRQLSRVRKNLLKSLARWSQSTMHISLTSDILDNISSLLEEWLASYYGK